MGRIERKRWEKNDKVREPLEASTKRELTTEELAMIRASYTGAGGLVSSGWDNGQFFTPPVVTEFVVDLLQIRSGAVLEPSCGGGAFLSALPFSCSVVGVEMMTEASRVAQLLHPAAAVHQGDALEMAATLAGRFDYVVGNPPFADVRHLDTYQGFEIALKQKRLEWYFLELSLLALRPGGVMALVVPDGILSNSKDKDRRKWLLHNYWLRAVISLPPETFKLTGTSVKTSVLVVQKPVAELVHTPSADGWPIAAPPDSRGDVLMAVCSEIGWDSRGRKTGKCDLPAILGEWRAMYPAGFYGESARVETREEEAAA